MNELDPTKSPLEAFMPGIDDAIDDYWLVQMSEHARAVQANNGGELSGPTEYELTY